MLHTQTVGVSQRFPSISCSKSLGSGLVESASLPPVQPHSLMRINTRSYLWHYYCEREGVFHMVARIGVTWGG